MATFLGVDVTKKAVYKDKDKKREKIPAKKVKEQADYHKKKYSIGSLYVSGSIYDVNGKLDDSCRFAKIIEDDGLSEVSVMEYEQFGRKETGPAAYQYADFDKSFEKADSSASALFAEGERLRKEAELKIKSEYVEPVVETDDDFEKVR